MKILTFCAYYTPEIVASMYLTENLLEDWAKAGFDVDVYAPTPTRGVSKETRKEYKKKKDEYKYSGKVHIHRFSLYGEGKNTLLRAFRYFLLIFKFFFCGLKSNAHVMFIDSTPPIQGIMAAWLKKVKKIPYVYNLQDIFPDSLVNTGICHRNSLLFKIGRAVEKTTYKNAEKIIAISDDFKDNILNKGVPEHKIAVVPNWVEDDIVVFKERKDNILFDKYNLDRDKFYISYSGNIGFTQNMEMLLSVAEEIRENKNIAFIIVGDGGYKAELERQIVEKGLKNIHLIPFQDYKDISLVFSLGDIGLIISKKGIGTNSVPSKTWSYMSASRPVLVSFDKDSTLCRLVSDIGCGVCVDADDKDGFKNAVLNLSNSSDLTRMGNIGRKYIQKNLNRNVCVTEYTKVLKEIGENGSN